MVRPARCFITEAQARSAGYRPAPLPAGDVAVGPIFLTPPGPLLEVRCRDGARRTGFAIPCPGLLPSGGDLAGVYPARGSFVLLWNFGGPRGYKGIPTGSSNHLFVFALSGRVSQQDFGGCPAQKLLARTTVRGHAAELLACAAGSENMNAGHVVIRWRERGVVYEVSLHNPTNVNRRIAEAVASSVRLVG
jgi:hypothetical protein